jgi:hypothetical protein
MAEYILAIVVYVLGRRSNGPAVVPKDRTTMELLRLMSRTTTAVLAGCCDKQGPSEAVETSRITGAAFE